MAKLIQYYEDDILGAVQFIDTYANRPNWKAQPSHIRLHKTVPESERKQLRRAIADDINGVGNERQEAQRLNTIVGRNSRTITHIR